MQTEENIRTKTVLAVAKRMMLAARTAPKARGVDNLEIALVENQTIELLSEKMKEIGNEKNINFFIRDSENILKATAIVIIGTKIKSMGLTKCGYCGFKNCEEKEKYPDVPCALNSNDLGIAIGSAVSIAMDGRIDNRVMFSIGNAAIELGLLGEDVKIAFGIPLSATSKNPFFDRK